MTHCCDTRFFHFPALLPLCSIVLVLGAGFSTNVLMHAMHCAAPAVYHMHARHYITPHSTHSIQPGACFAACWLSPLASHCLFERPPSYVPLHQAFGVERQHLPVKMCGGGDLGEYTFLKSANSSSLSKM